MASRDHFLIQNHSNSGGRLEHGTDRSPGNAFSGDHSVPPVEWLELGEISMVYHPPGILSTVDSLHGAPTYAKQLSGLSEKVV